MITMERGLATISRENVTVAEPGLDSASAPKAGEELRAAAKQVIEKAQPPEMPRNEDVGMRARLANTARFYAGPDGVAQDWTHILATRTGIVGGVAAGVATAVGLGIGAVPVAAGICVGYGLQQGVTLLSDRAQRMLWGKSYYEAV